MAKTLILPYRPTGDQVTYFNLDTRFTIGCIGRQYGKSTIAKIRSVKKQLTAPPNIYWYVTPVNRQAKVQFKRVIKFYPTFIKRVNRSELEIELLNGSIWQFKGSDDYVNLKGDTLAGATLDECGSMHPEVWLEVVRPMLAVNGGWCDFIGTPKGKNWFYDLWRNAEYDKEFSKHHAPSNLSPYFPKSEYEKIKENTPEATFRQEYMAEFLDSSGNVFRGYNECIGGEFEEPNKSREYLVAVDLAKYHDWTVITTWDIERRHMVNFQRFNQIDWTIQESRIMSTIEKYNSAECVIDATGVGDPIFERLQRRGARIHPVKFNSTVKEHLIESLMMALEKREITFPYVKEIIHELSVFEIERTPTGNVRYNAPSGQHDDIVISIALAVDRLTRPAVKQYAYEAK